MFIITIIIAIVAIILFLSTKEEKRATHIVVTYFDDEPIFENEDGYIFMDENSEEGTDSFEDMPTHMGMFRGYKVVKHARRGTHAKTWKKPVRCSKKERALGIFEDEAIETATR